MEKKYCSNNRRNAESLRKYKNLLLKTIYTISDVDVVVERSRFEMSFKYFLKMAPEKSVVNAGAFTKFRKLALKDTDLLHLLIGKTGSIAIKKGDIRSRSIIVDTTHSLSRSNSFSAVQVLKERSKIQQKAIYTIDENWIERMP